MNSRVTECANRFVRIYEEGVLHVILKGKLCAILESKELETGTESEGTERPNFLRSVKDLECSDLSRLPMSLNRSR